MSSNYDVWNAVRAIAWLVAVSMRPSNSIGQIEIEGKPYIKLETRERTREMMLARLQGAEVRWGEWKLLAPFDHPPGGKSIDTPFGPELDMASCSAGGPGPDLMRTFNGKRGKAIGWRDVPDEQGIGGPGGPGPINLDAGLSAEDARNAVGYLYRAITCDRASSIEVATGSDDGLRLWLNGRLLVDASAERPLDPGAHVVRLELQPGVNHLLAKVSQGAGEWQFQLTPRAAIDPDGEAALDWQLDTDYPDDESRHYRIATVAVPADLSLEVGGLGLLPDGRPIACTRRGEVWIFEHAYGTPAIGVQPILFASGLHEPLGLAVRPDPRAKKGSAIDVAQRGELTRLIDTDGDDRADLFVTLCDAWQVSGNYHEFAFGPKYDMNGDAWVTLNLAHTGGETVMGATVATRGWAVRVSPDGVMHKVCDGLRSPDGIGMYSDGQMFYTDNQGDYVATCKLSPLFEGSFHGHQASLRFREGWSNWKTDGMEIPGMTPAAIWFPYKKMGQSASEPVLTPTDGSFGPFGGQFMVGDQTHATIMRVILERVEGVYQGACFPFKNGFASGVHRLAFAPDGSLMVGMTDRGWGSTGPKRSGLQRLLWTGVTPFEMLTMRAAPDGFDLEFTHDLEEDADQAGYEVSSHTYLYRPEYGSPETDTKALKVTAKKTGPRSVHLTVSPLRVGGVGYVHELRIEGLRSAAGSDGRREHLLHPTAYYTLQRIPGRP
ncbi:MAG: hypothetical protein JNM07_09790 [Phycisphaerae bacterium]|nr:hypothetical protein [Phycisphaerae bacterium]